MPLKSGKSANTRSANIAELLRTFKGTGRIGNSKPANMKKATAESVAIAYRKAGEK